MIRLRLLPLLLLTLSFQTGCSSSADSTTPAAGNVDSNGQTVSSVPWNKPEDWETQGQLGAAAGH